MGEFANKIRRHAEETLRHVYLQEVTPKSNPILELVGCLLEDGAGGISAPEETPVTTEQWYNWNQLALERQQELDQTVMRVLDREKLELPLGPDAMRNWAANLLLSTLDQLGML